MDIESYSKASGRILKEDGSYVNEANLLDAFKGTVSKAITGTSLVEPPNGFYFWCIVPVADTVVSAQVDVSGAENADLTTLTSLPTGLPIYTNLTSITLTSGEAIGYCLEV